MCPIRAPISNVAAHQYAVCPAAYLRTIVSSCSSNCSHLMTYRRQYNSTQHEKHFQGLCGVN